MNKSRSFEILLRTTLLTVRAEPLMTDRGRREWTDRHRRHLAGEREFTRRLDRLDRCGRDVVELFTERPGRVALPRDHRNAACP